MARIVYGVAGEGFGHSSRSHIIGQRLIDAGHEVMFAGSEKSYTYLKQYFGDRVQKVFGLLFVYKNGQVRPVQTFIKNASKIKDADRRNRILFRKHIEPFKPDLVISDFEPFCAWWALRKRVPFISVDHEHMLDCCKLEHKISETMARLTATSVTWSYYFGAEKYVILNFFKAPLIHKKALIVPPILRSEVLERESKPGKHILVYSTTGQRLEELLETFGKFSNEQFLLYGYGERESVGNCTFRPRSTEGFLDDLTSCKGVIATAGFTLIAESLHYRKPMCLMPIPHQYEQIINTQYIESTGFGIYAKKLDEPTLERFIKITEQPISQDERILYPNNELFFEQFGKVLSELPTPVEL